MSSPEGRKSEMSIEADFQTRLHTLIKKEEDPAQVAQLLLKRLDENGGEISSLRDLFMTVVADIEAEYQWRKEQNPHGLPVEKLPDGTEKNYYIDSAVESWSKHQMTKFADRLREYATQVALKEKINPSTEEQSRLRHEAWKFIDRAKYLITKRRDTWYDDLFSDNSSHS